jgi:hypothetical protein
MKWSAPDAFNAARHGERWVTVASAAGSSELNKSSRTCAADDVAMSRGKLEGGWGRLKDIPHAAKMSPVGHSISGVMTAIHHS